MLIYVRAYLKTRIENDENDEQMNILMSALAKLLPTEEEYNKISRGLGDTSIFSYSQWQITQYTKHFLHDRIFYSNSDSFEMKMDKIITLAVVMGETYLPKVEKLISSFESFSSKKRKASQPLLGDNNWSDCHVNTPSQSEKQKNEESIDYIKQLKLFEYVNIGSNRGKTIVLWGKPARYWRQSIWKQYHGDKEIKRSVNADDYENRSCIFVSSETYTEATIPAEIPRNGTAFVCVEEKGDRQEFVDYVKEKQAEHAKHIEFSSDRFVERDMKVVGISAVVF
jgi:hypothetical protein